MALPAATAQDLGDLINTLNPYTGNTLSNGAKTGDMEIYTAVSVAAPPPPPGGHRDQIMIEVDSKYPGEWTFKGQPQKINKAVRIRYRFPVTDPTTGSLLYWVEDYLLIGFEGSNGGS